MNPSDKPLDLIAMVANIVGVDRPAVPVTRCRKCAGTGIAYTRVNGENVEGTCANCRGMGYADEIHCGCGAAQHRDPSGTVTVHRAGCR